MDDASPSIESLPDDVNELKRRLVPLSVAAAGANVHDKRLVGPTLNRMMVSRPNPLRDGEQHLCGDKRYDYADVQWLVDFWSYTAHIKSRGEERGENQRIPHYRARRWVVERTHSWLNRFRRLMIRWEKKAVNYVGMLHFACATITFRAAWVLG